MPKATTPDLKLWPEIRPDYRVETFRARMHEYAITFAAEVDLQDVSFVRPSPIAQFADQSRAAGDTFQSVGTLEDAVIALSQQPRIYLADMPQLREEFDFMRSEVLPGERVASMQSDLQTNAAAADRLAASAECSPEAALNERRIVLEEMSRQRALVMEAISVEREQAVDAMVRGFATEGSALLRSVDEQRLATLEWATAERRETITEIQRELAASIEAIRGERAVAVNELRDIIDLELLRVALFLAAAVVLAPLVAHAYVRVWPRRWREHPEVMSPRR
jgi:hypothetical protein